MRNTLIAIALLLAASTVEAARPPAAPSNLAASAVSQTAIQLAWTDRASNETGQTVQRCLGTGCLTFTGLVSLPANITTYTDGSLAASTTACYRVRAFSGNRASGWSNIACATTPSDPTPVLDPTPAPTPTPTAPCGSPGSTACGPQASIACPIGAISIFPGTNNIQAVVNSYPAASTFCLRAGLFSLTSSVTPKTGDSFTGEYGAVLDGSNWATTDYTQAAFRAHNQDIDTVVIRNLVVQKMPGRAIHAFPCANFIRGAGCGADHWTIENVELAYNLVGIVLPNYGILRNSYLHHNAGNAAGTYEQQGGNYQVYQATDVLIETSELSYGGVNAKASLTWAMVWRGNWVHNNQDNGIWMDGENPGCSINHNLVEDHPAEGVDLEVSEHCTVTSNTIRRSGDSAIFTSTSHGMEFANNVMEDNWRGINIFVDCPRVNQGGEIADVYDLIDVSVHDNTTRVSNTLYAYASLVQALNCSTTQAASYLDGSHNVTFTRNTYMVPSVTGPFWYWGTNKSWSQWQVIPQDATGSAL